MDPHGVNSIVGNLNINATMHRIVVPVTGLRIDNLATDIKLTINQISVLEVGQTISNHVGRLNQSGGVGNIAGINDGIIPLSAGQIFRLVAFHQVAHLNAEDGLHASDNPLVILQLLIGFPEEEVAVKMSLLVPVAGRFQTFVSPRGYTAIVDYAHTPDALVNVLDTIRDVVGTKGKIITVVGAGGNRDKGKRPIMAKEAARRSDRLILTSDNPRFEDPEEILRDMEAGLDDADRRHTLKITDRREAIKAATCFAEPGDVVLVAGKGHEDYQEVKGVKHHFDDKEVLLSQFEEEKQG